jgi:hypothetical protein
VHDRAFLLSEGKRNDLLELWEVQQYGRDSFGDPDYVCLYGLRPAAWYERGVRILARTAVECTRDRLAVLIGRDLAEVARAAAGMSGPLVVDPFAGSGNTLYWMKRQLAASRAVGFEVDDAVFTTTQNNLLAVGLDVELFHEDYTVGLQALHLPDDQLAVVFIAPPWGEALSQASGLNLGRTTPPVGEVIDLIAARLAGHRLLFGVQLYERVDPGSLAAVAARFAWSARKRYDINAPGHNHGLLLGTHGWAP